MTTPSQKRAIEPMNPPIPTIQYLVICDVVRSPLWDFQFQASVSLAQREPMREQEYPAADRNTQHAFLCI